MALADSPNWGGDCISFPRALNYVDAFLPDFAIHGKSWTNYFLFYAPAT